MLAALCAAYWYPLYAFVRRKGYDPDGVARPRSGVFHATSGERRPGFRRSLQGEVSLFLDGRVQPLFGE